MRAISRLLPLLLVPALAGAALEIGQPAPSLDGIATWLDERPAPSLAVELTAREDGAILDTLAAVYYRLGLLDRAIAVQEQAVARAEADD